VRINLIKVSIITQDRITLFWVSFLLRRCFILQASLLSVGKKKLKMGVLMLNFVFVFGLGQVEATFFGRGISGFVQLPVYFELIGKML